MTIKNGYVIIDRAHVEERPPKTNTEQIEVLYVKGKPECGYIASLAGEVAWTDKTEADYLDAEGIGTLRETYRRVYQAQQIVRNDLGYPIHGPIDDAPGTLAESRGWFYACAWCADNGMVVPATSSGATHMCRACASENAPGI